MKRISPNLLLRILLGNGTTITARSVSSWRSRGVWSLHPQHSICGGLWAPIPVYHMGLRKLPSVDGSDGFALAPPAGVSTLATDRLRTADVARGERCRQGCATPRAGASGVWPRRLADRRPGRWTARR